jgi:hypothetical protein
VTREPASHIPDEEYWRDHFIDKARSEGVDLIWRTTMLSETEEYWTSKGELRLDKLEAEGVEPKSWWF